MENILNTLDSYLPYWNNPSHACHIYLFNRGITKVNFSQNVYALISYSWQGIIIPTVFLNLYSHPSVFLSPEPRVLVRKKISWDNKKLKYINIWDSRETGTVGRLGIHCHRCIAVPISRESECARIFFFLYTARAWFLEMEKAMVLLDQN